MDRFADRRFEAFFEGAEPVVSDARVAPDRDDPLSSPHFDALIPPLIRWIADARGRLLVRGESPHASTDPFPAIRSGYDWRRALDPVDRKALLQAATHSANPRPLRVRMMGADGERRWAGLRMTCVSTGRGGTRWYGTIEYLPDLQDEVCALREALAEAREHYRWSVELNPQVPWTARADGALEEIGPRLREMTGISLDPRSHLRWNDMLHPDDAVATMARWDDHVQSGEPIIVEQRVRLTDGGYRWMRSKAAVRRDARGEVIRWYGTLEDIHDQKVAQDALAESEGRFRLAVQAAGLGIWDFDIETGARTWSPELRAMLGLADDVPATQECAMALVHPDDRSILQNMMATVARREATTHFEATLRIHRADDGALRWIRSMGWTTQSAGGRPKRVLVTFQDVTDQEEADARIRWAAGHDAMTGLPNRAAWQATLEQMTARADETGERFGLMLFDIDDLKRTNDALGHDAGDALLCEFAARLLAMAPPGAVLGRLGGDEFGLIATSLRDSDALQAISAAILENIRRPYVHDGRSLDCGVSIGGAVYGEHGRQAGELFKSADLALYASKASGRGRVTLFHSDLRAQAQQHSSMIRMARQAVSDKLITPYYQPKVDLHSGQTVGFEALLRWHHPRLGVQTPATIAAAFENCELAVAMTDRMLDAIVRDVRRWIRAGFDPGRVAFNASAADFMDDDFAQAVLRRFARGGVSPRHFEIEVTETVFLGRGADNVARALHRFSKAGVRVALDDFGTGYASLSHLKQYPVDVLKIDRSFINHLEGDAGDAAIVDAIVKLGTSLSIEVIAEGVETQRQRELLIDHGCRFGQGYLLGYPAPFVSPPKTAT
ncbi:EAL domain-containing protein [Sphingobium sp. AN558]|uniref:putative bifunctional diguanylate cyclase/phosphodiesterase n=1 Tax=Sphingobium sp. AN558 TaxID=3133442 RepID=UPI0030BDE47F